jgi:hypothetical protein
MSFSRRKKIRNVMDETFKLENSVLDIKPCFASPVLPERMEFADVKKPAGF